MSLSTDLLDTFGELGYQLASNVNLDSISLIDFSKILHWLSIQFHFYANTESIINVINAESDLASLRIELNSLFNELDSIYVDKFLLDNVSNRLEILNSLAGDLLASRIMHIDSNKNNDEIFSNNLNPKNDMKIIKNCLSIPNECKDIKKYFDSIKQNFDKYLLKYYEDSLLLPEHQKLSPQQWNKLTELNEKLANEYSIRRELLLRRADMTVSSFSWNEEKNREMDEQKIKVIYENFRKKWSNRPKVTLSHALAARNSDCDLLINKRISINHASCFIQTAKIGTANAGLQQRLQLHKYLIGAVPDRGGRPFEQPPPPKETFSQQQSQRENRGRGGGGYRNNNDRRQQQQQSNQNYHNQQPRNNTNYHQTQHYNRLPDNFSGGDRIQNAGWQQQDYYGGGGGYHQYKDNYHHHQQSKNDNYRHKRGGRGGGGHQNYHHQQQRGYYGGGGGGYGQNYY